MMTKLPSRKTLEETWLFLEKEGKEMPRTSEGQPFIASKMPSFDDEEPGFSFFRTLVADADFSHLTLPKTYFGRSSLEGVNFQNTDLSESRICWNDFIGCDFSKADLSACDMRASTFKNCTFNGTNLKGADFRHSAFEGCHFTGADLTGAIVDTKTGKQEGLFNSLDESQMITMKITARPGKPPGGG